MFKDTQAYLLPTGIGGPRVKLFKTKLAEQGGAIANDESTATHVVVAESMEMPRLFKIIDPQKVSSSAKIVRCTWISDSLKAGLLQPTLPYELSRTVDSPERHDAPISKRVRHADASFISEASGSTSTAQAETGSLQPKHDSRKPFVSNNWVCATASEEAPVNRNSFITDQLQAMVETYQSTNDHWRALGYEKAIRVLKQHPSEITSREEARSLPNVGERLADKILEIIQQGKLQKLQEFQSQEKLVALNLFTKIWGSGPSTAEKWVQQVSFVSSFSIVVHTGILTKLNLPH